MFLQFRTVLFLFFVRRSEIFGFGRCEKLAIEFSLLILRYRFFAKKKNYPNPEKSRDGAAHTL